MNANGEQRNTRLRMLKRRYAYVKLAHNIIGLPLIILVLIFGLPIVGNLTGMLFFEAIGCTGDAAGGVDCSFLGKDVGDIAYGYMIGMLLAGIINPLLVLQFLCIYIPVQFVLVWALAAIGLTLARYLTNISIKQIS